MLEYIGDIFHHFVDPKKRVFLGYIAACIYKEKGVEISNF